MTQPGGAPPGSILYLSSQGRNHFCRNLFSIHVERKGQIDAHSLQHCSVDLLDQGEGVARSRTAQIEQRIGVLRCNLYLSHDEAGQSRALD